MAKEERLHPPKKPARPGSFSEGENESPQLIEDEPVEVERDVPDIENKPLERDEQDDEPDPPLFEE
jgi:hypothetical protein